MVLEKIIRSAKIINTSPGIYAGLFCAGMSLAAAAYSDENNTALFAFAGTLTALSAWGAVREHKEYQKVANYCEQRGFDRWIMVYEESRNKAEIYASSENRVPEFNLARKDYRV
ncbi:MAG: hypothetical protein AABX24_04280 [Nanoarchaeota archaeon]